MLGKFVQHSKVRARVKHGYDVNAIAFQPALIVQRGINALQALFERS